MNIAFVTNSRAPYRSLQINKISEIPGTKFDVYYTDKEINGREWSVKQFNNFKEYSLYGRNLIKSLISIIKSYDVIILGGYDKKEYIFLSLLCKFFKKKYILLFDGISPKKINLRETRLIYIIKKFVIKSAFSIWGNGEVSKLYFSKKFKYPEDKIYNQYLTVDVERIIEMSKSKDKIRDELINLYKIPKSKRIVLYSGRLICRKNIDIIIKAISKLDNCHEYLLLIVGDGEEKQRLLNLAKDANINIFITGFIKEQEELFKFYYIADLLVLPSYDEPWGLVVNEAMAASLPVIVSDECGVSLDLIENDLNGFVVEAGNDNELAKAIKNVFTKGNKIMGEKSLSIIKNYTFENSKLSMKKILDYL